VPANDRQEQGTVELPSTGSLISCPKRVVDRSGPTNCRAQLIVGLNEYPCMFLHVRKMEWFHLRTHPELYGLGIPVQCAVGGSYHWRRHGSFCSYSNVASAKKNPCLHVIAPQIAHGISPELACCTTEACIMVQCNAERRISR
jgi:hypothetical protein